MEAEKQNKYLNSLRYVDSVLEQLYLEFEKRKLIDDTYFLLIGDHGIGFLEHSISGTCCDTSILHLIKLNRCCIESV